MILADTSVWIDHLRNDNSRLRECLINNQVCIHPFVIGEIACGSLKNRSEILHLLQSLPHIPVAGHREVLELVLNMRLYNEGIGWIDAHLLASALISKVTLWTLDKRLAKIASHMQ